MLIEVNNRILSVVGVVAVSATGIGVWLYVRYSRQSCFERELIMHELSKLRVEVELLRIDVQRIEYSTGKVRSPTKVRQRSVTFEAECSGIDDVLSTMNRVKSTQSISSDGEYADACEEWDNDTITVPCLYDPSRRSITIPKISFADVDLLFGTDDVAKAYDNLKKHYDGGDKGNAELLWRLAKSCHEVACRTNDKNKKKDLLFEGRQYGVDAMTADENNFLAVKWAAVMTGQCTDFLGTKEKIEQGGKFKEYLDKALTMDPKEYSLLHMRGRYSFSVASLTWLERKAASVLYGTPPTATYDEALKDFLDAYEQKSDWIENLVYIARCYMQKQEKANAKKYLLLAKELKATDDAEIALLDEATKLLTKC
ncbi:unnamed protein product [Auanema sp. JU1783]|nr:unnamed protein product [Auanema sp. JU1783]